MNADWQAAALPAGHDLGGARGFGRIKRGRAQFAEAWEESAFALTLACGMLGRWNLDQSRYARERMPAAEYLASSYYEHWLHGLEHLLLECGLVSADELRSGTAEVTDESGATPAAVTVARAMQILACGAPTVLPATADARFAVGSWVRVTGDFRGDGDGGDGGADGNGHTRAPRYTHGKRGQVVRHNGAHVFPDVHAAAGEKQPQHLYSVRFAADELWDDAEADAAVYVDLFEPYLRGADGDGGDDSA